MFRSDTVDTIHNIIIKSKNVIISTHTNPDGDALGSSLALMWYLKSLGKKAVIINDSPNPYNYKQLPGAESIIVYSREKASDYFMMADTIFVLDLNESRRLKSVEEMVVNSRLNKVLIDHHLEPKNFCNHNYINTDASSTGELVWEIINHNKDFKITPEIAENLYVAIMTDTGSFRFPRTNGRLHRIIADLIDAGADPVKCYDDVYNQNTIGAQRLLGEAMSKIELHFNDKVAIMTVSRNQMVKNGCLDSDIDNFVEKTLTIQGVKIGVFIAEMINNDELRISLRSKENYSAREIAVQIGGGGHFHASGARLFNVNLNEGIKQVISIISGIFVNL